MLGGDGMLGHQLLKSLAVRHEVKVTLRLGLDAYREHGLFTRDNAQGGIDVRSHESLLEVINVFSPHVIINAIGLVKQRLSANEAIPSLEINSLLPHRLAMHARAAGARLIHFSTDCVFSGRKGGYSEDDVPDAEDLYGRTKLLGEITEHNSITLRTSIIGRELARKTSLVEWFLAQRTTVHGFRRAIYSGFTTIEMARIVERLMVEQPQLHGVWHVSSEPIDKYTLLGLIKRYFGLSTEILPDDGFVCDRSLDSSRFRAAFGYRPPTWDRMIEEMSR